MHILFMRFVMACHVLRKNPTKTFLYLSLSRGTTSLPVPNLQSGLFVGCLTSRQHATVSQGRICSDNFTCCHTEAEVADPTFCLTQSQYTDTGPTSPRADPITPGAWQGSHRSANFEVTGMTRPGKIPSQAGFEPRIFRSRGRRLTTKPARLFAKQKHFGVK